MPMPNRNLEGGYRYGYQGEFAEKDPETGLNAFELRLWDARIGRWLSIDPYGRHFSPYLGMGNNPIFRIDPDGGCDTPPCPEGQQFVEPKINFLTGELEYPGFVALDEVYIGSSHTVKLDGYLGQARFWLPAIATYGDYLDLKNEALNRIVIGNRILLFGAETVLTLSVGAHFKPQYRPSSQVKDFNPEFVNRNNTLNIPLGSVHINGKPIYRGIAPVRINDVKMDINGSVKTTHGISTDLDINSIPKRFTIKQIHSIPDGLQIIQRGSRETHYEIVPVKPMSFEEYSDLISKIIYL